MLNLISFIWYWLYRLAPGEWLIAIGLAWWGLFKDGADQYLLCGLAVLVLLLSWVAKAMSYVIFVPAAGEGWHALSGQSFTSVRGAAVGEFLRYSDPVLRLHVRALRVGLPVLLHWFGADRPPHLALLAPQTIDARNRHVFDNASHWALWYPGSAVRQGTVYLKGREQPGLELSFAGRRMVVALEAEADAAAVQAVLAENA